MRKILTLLSVVLFLSSAYSQTLYVAPTGAAANDGTLASPTTLESAITRIAAGGTIYMRGGTYNYSSTIVIARGNDGSSGNTKKIFAYQNEVPVLNFSAMSESSSNRGIVLDALYWHLRGLVIQNAGDNGILLSGNNNTVESCIFRGNRDTGLQLSRYNTSYNTISQWPSNNLILNCEAYDNRDSGNENADGFAAKLTSGNGNVFRGCVAHHNIDDGWDLYTKSDTGPIGAVTLENCIAHSNGTLTTGGTSGNGDKNGFKLGGEDISVNHIVRRCIAFNNGKHGFTYNRNLGSIEMTNNTGYNNTERNFNFDGGTSVFKNNLSFQSGSNDRIIGNASAPNAFTGASSGFTINSADFVTLTPGPNASPTSNGFLNLASGSDAINAGVTSTGISYNGSSPDLGAVESGSTSTTFTLTTNSSPLNGGSVTRTPDATAYNSGTVVTLTAVPASGYTFTGWSGAASGTASTVTVTMDANKTVTANFTQTTTSYTLTVNASPSNGGSITHSPNASSYTSGTVVTITPVPASGWQFSGWSGDLSGNTNPASITMNANKSVTANFTQVGSALTIQENQSGVCSFDGTIDSDNAGYTGSGFVNTPNSSGQGISWAVNVPSGGTYGLAWRHANGATADRTAQVMVDGSTVVSNASFTGTGSWTTWATTSAVNVTLSAGNHIIRLQATTSAGLSNIDYIQISGGSPSIGSCSSNASPTVSITSPSNGASFTAPANLTINATASDSDGSIASVQFFQGSTLLGTDTSSPYSFTWSNVAAGSYSLTARATDNAGAVTTSAAMSITVTGTATITIQENQSGVCSFDGTVDSDNSGFTGSGFINTPNSSGQGVNWSVSVPSTGTYALSWRYANGTTTGRAAQVMVDGSTAVSSVAFAGSGAWTTWTTTSTVNVSLSAGTHTIRLQATTSAGLANIDYIEITGNSPSAGNCSSSARAVIPSLDGAAEENDMDASSWQVFPNPTKGTLNVSLDDGFSKEALVQLFDNTGRMVRVNKERGTHHVFDVKELPSGVYLVRITAGRLTQTRRVMVE